MKVREFIKTYELTCVDIMLILCKTIKDATLTFEELGEAAILAANNIKEG